MMQLYFLSVLTLLFTGFILTVENENREKPIIGNNQTLLLSLGLVTIIIGILKFFIVVQPDIYFFGDLLPAIAGLFGGFTLLLEFYLAHSTVDIKINTIIETIFIKGKKYIGIFCIVISVLHFFFPKIRIL